MANHIYGNSANDVWKKALEEVRNRKNEVPGRGGNVYELLHTFVSISNPKQKWVYSRIPAMSIAFALAELVWIMNGDDRADIINYWNASLSKFAGQGDYYYGAYGKRIRAHFGFDQMERAYQALQNNKESRQVVIQIYDTKTDFPYENGEARDADIPCNICSLLKIRDDKLEWSQIMRSNDIYLGMPYNFIQYTGIQEILAGWLQIGLGSYNHYSDSLHLYERDLNKINIEENSNFYNTDSLGLPKKESDKIFSEIYRRMGALAKEKCNENSIYELSYIDSGFEAYDNVMRVISAYAAQKEGSIGLANELINSCTNKLYQGMWEKWFERKRIRQYE